MIAVKTVVTGVTSISCWDLCSQPPQTHFMSRRSSNRDREWDKERERDEKWSDTLPSITSLLMTRFDWQLSSVIISRVQTATVCCRGRITDDEDEDEDDGAVETSREVLHVTSFITFNTSFSPTLRTAAAAATSQPNTYRCKQASAQRPELFQQRSTVFITTDSLLLGMSILTSLTHCLSSFLTPNALQSWYPVKHKVVMVVHKTGQKPL